MKRRAWKYAGLVLTGGVLFQAASCTALLTDTFTSYILPLIFSQLAAGTTP